MKKFLYLTIGGKMPANEAEREKVMAAWMAWFGTLGKNLVEPGAPLGDRKTLGATFASKATGYCIVQAADLKAAIFMAKGVPALAAGDSIEILEITPQEM